MIANASMKADVYAPRWPRMGMIAALRRMRPMVWVMLAGGIVLMDCLVPSDIILAVLLFFPVALASWFDGRGWGLTLAMGAPLAHFYFDDFSGPHALPLATAVMNNGAALAVFSVIAILIDIVVRQRGELQGLVYENNLVLK